MPVTVKFCTWIYYVERTANSEQKMNRSRVHIFVGGVQLQFEILW